MKLIPAAACLLAVASSATASKTTGVRGRTLADDDSKTFVASMGKYGSFKMTLYGDDTMDYVLKIRKADELFSDSTGRGYHLHSGFLGDGASVGSPGTTAPACGSSATLGHYDPFEACGPASTAQALPCAAPANYCSDKRDSVLESGAAANACEVGDLSGRFGALPGGNKFTVTETGVACPGCLDDYLESAADAAFDTWGSIVFHDAGPRVLCANLVDEDDDSQ